MTLIHPENQRFKGVGVGLRSQHFYDFLESDFDLQFVEVHAENYYMDGGPALDMLAAVRAKIDVSIHATSLGLGSAGQVPAKEIEKLKKLIDLINPVFVSDHACFSWSSGGTGILHAGDLLPIQFTERSLDNYCKNVDRVQQVIGRQILVENVSTYLRLPGSTMQEFDFLQQVCIRTGAGLLLDINNIFVNVYNAGSEDMASEMSKIISSVDPVFVKEIHLAGASVPTSGELMVDNHATAPTCAVWLAYSEVLAEIGPRPTLVEWDTELPAWEVLVTQARIASAIIDKSRKHHG